MALKHDPDPKKLGAYILLGTYSASKKHCLILDLLGEGANHVEALVNVIE